MKKNWKLKINYFDQHRALYLIKIDLFLTQSFFQSLHHASVSAACAICSSFGKQSAYACSDSYTSKWMICTKCVDLFFSNIKLKPLRWKSFFKCKMTQHQNYCQVLTHRKTAWLKFITDKKGSQIPHLPPDNIHVLSTFIHWR